MLESEARAILKAHGWGYLVRKRKGDLPYIYAVRREKQTVKDCYIAPLSHLPYLTEADIVAKLEQSSRQH